ncbi:gremlin-1-like [Hydractinia symbiolongicarpus]|uniref:gremlin-1-like n=1 Tax=Hydractinia symbiolongicarpus TaxID=13093 RepID=UPI00254F150B|nr:gremlin-1-like [Hydractinia symbiolongicarpus]XP_057316214.1 gremlin-1-like [Hydractinia symbiolongicarpus]
MTTNRFVNITTLILLLATITDTFNPQNVTRDNKLSRLKNAILKNEDRVIYQKAAATSSKCETKLFNVTISYKNCVTKKVQAKYCTGSCHTIYIPGEPNLKICRRCLPIKFSFARAQLDCPSAKSKKQRHFRYINIKKCRCLMC